MARRSTTDERNRLRIEAGRRVSALREARHMKQKELAQAVGVTPSTISAIESGTRGMPSDQRVRIAEALGIAPDHLDAAVEPNLDISTFLAFASGIPGDYSAPRTGMSGSGSRLPPGLEGYFERHPEVAKQKRIRWYLENQTFKAEPWVTFDDKFWGEMYEFWKRYLRELDEEGGAAGAAPAPGRRR